MGRPLRISFGSMKRTDSSTVRSSETSSTPRSRKSWTRSSTSSSGALAPEVISASGLAAQSSEPAMEAPLSRAIYPLVAFAIAFAFRAAVRRQARELRQIASELEHASDAKDRFLRHIGHEFRTPLHVLLANTDQALAVERDPEQRARIEAARTSANALLIQLNQVIEFASGNLAKPPAAGESFSPLALVNGCLVHLQEVANNKSLRLIADIDPALPKHYHGNAESFSRILEGLAENALRFTDSGSVSIKLAATAGAVSGLRLVVADTGVGMSMQQVDRAFEAFGRADQSMTRRSGGLGLGLPRIRELVEGLDGQIHCRSFPGRGTTMVVDLPLTPLRETPIAGKANGGQPQRQDRPDDGIAARSLMLLVCEDDSACRDLLVAGLETLGHRTREAADGVEGLAQLAEQHFDAVITDLEMPNLDGHGLLRAIREQHQPMPDPTVPVIVVTASATVTNSPEILALGFDAILPKPFVLGDMQRALSDLVPRGPAVPVR